MHELLVADARRPREIDAFRAVVRRAMEKRYTGWRDDFDAQFDDRSLFFYLHTDQQEFAATARATLRQRNGTSGPLCIELADRAPYIVPEAPDRWPNIVEGSSMTYRDMEHLPLFMLALGNYAEDHDIGPCYSTLDLQNPVVQMYETFGGWQRVDTPPVIFDSLRHRDREGVVGEPVPWQVVRLGWNTIRERIATLRSALQLDEEPRFRELT